MWQVSTNFRLQNSFCYEIKVSCQTQDKENNKYWIHMCEKLVFANLDVGGLTIRLGIQFKLALTSWSTHVEIHVFIYFEWVFDKEKKSSMATKSDFCK